MTLPLCDQVTERVALGDALGELAEHVATCPSCQQLIAMTNKLGATHHAVDPGLGFSARMTVGAQHLLGVRRRRRLAVGLAASVATGAFGVFLVTRSPELPATVATHRAEQPLAQDPQSSEVTPPEVESDVEVEVEDHELAALVDLANVERSLRVSADWSRIKKPLMPYRKVLKGEEP